MNTTKQADVFQAIASPLRRDILHKLALSGDQSITTISEDFAVSRQAVTRHLSVLADAGVVQIHKQGREQICALHADALVQVAEWVSFYRQFWDRKLDAIGDVLDGE
ncbi:MAG: transcriptional regulator [Chloroflexi bacterium]|nr:MAG: transcriptional regulator [Chloroflexota bacterium]MBL1194490.1 transcriptional regulator [Chloroflexota bacterium]NOH11778.1 helix-turn-helix transcriptional regulator [Chloroflexota bacterium]